MNYKIFLILGLVIGIGVVGFVSTSALSTGDRQSQPSINRVETRSSSSSSSAKTLNSSSASSITTPSSPINQTNSSTTSTEKIDTSSAKSSTPKADNNDKEETVELMPMIIPATDTSNGNIAG